MTLSPLPYLHLFSREKSNIAILSQHKIISDKNQRDIVSWSVTVIRGAKPGWGQTATTALPSTSLPSRTFNSSPIILGTHIKNTGVYICKKV